MPRPGVIHAPLNRALTRPSGGWFVMAGSREVGPGRAFGRVVAARELVAWRDDIAYAERRYALRTHLAHRVRTSHSVDHV